jgi:hypothetical protein
MIRDGLVADGAAVGTIMKSGITGLPQVGKTSLFKILTHAS